MNTAPASYQDLLARDSRPVPEILRPAPPREFSRAPLSVDRYISQEFFNREAARMWPRVWQMACREEELPNPGDCIVYEVVGQSLLVVRTESGAIKAYFNSCLHRGRKLLTEDAHVNEFRCAFHGFRWKLDGSNCGVPCRWDFDHLSDADLRLPEAKVGIWGGFVFVNMDDKAMPLEEYLGVLPQHFARWRLEDCYKAVHVGKRIDCNWKVAQEAFMESYHVIATHPQILPIIADANSQYDIYGRHVNRNLAAFGARSPHLDPSAASPQQIIDGMLQLWGKSRTPASLQGAQNPRAALGELNRTSFGRAFEGNFDAATDAELLDAMVYNVFPNFAPWGGFAPNIVYRWRPDGMDVNACIMEVMILMRPPRGKPRPPPVKMHWLEAHQSWSEAKELPILGAVIDQDMGNMGHVQRGLIASRTRKVQLGAYQESRIRHHHQTLDEYLSD